MLKDRRRKVIAFFFTFLLGIQIVTPATAYALTSGPTQPEMAKFTPAGQANLVDLFTGDLNYNIPLVDVGGYPVNLAYQSGTGIEDEASWVGMGWTLNSGSVNRTMRGIPDDFDGTKGDVIEKEHLRKEFKKVGGSVVLKPAIFSRETGSVSLRLNVYKDNYYGIGASVSAGISHSLAKLNSTTLTAGLNITSDTREGTTIAPSLSISQFEDERSHVDYVSPSLAGAFTYNSRAGLKDYSLSTSYSAIHHYKNERGWQSEDGGALGGRSAVHYFGQSYTPSITSNTRNRGFTFNFDLGPSILAGYLGLGGSGYTYSEKILDKVTSTPAFGYLHYLKGRDKENVLLDFNREKDRVFLPTTPAIATPVATHDFFTVTGQAGSHQFRPHFGGNYIVADKEFSNTTENTSGGITLGWGFNSFQAGARVERLSGDTRTKRWTENNQYLNSAQYTATNGSDEEPVYFKRVGEKTKFDNAFLSRMGGKDIRKVDISVTGGNSDQRSSALPVLLSANSSKPVNEPIQKQLNGNEGREVKNHLFQYLTASEAEKYGLEKKIKNYAAQEDIADGTIAKLSRVDNPIKKAHHISEVTVTDNEGKRMVYGIPVYNNQQQEITFSVQLPSTNAFNQARKTGLVTYETDAGGKPKHNVGRDELFSKTITPGYASSYLLTGILSSDYQDLTGNGISDDDLGTAVKFNYTKTSSNYKWRAPYHANKANYNEGFLNDRKDDKGSIVYGEKELWYAHSIESKTMIAFFITSDRKDGLGVLGVNGGKNTDAVLQQLDRIKLYSKAEWLKDKQNAVPIKEVVFDYDYSLYPGVPNNAVAGNGKLTLKKVYFLFGNNSRGQSNPYEFSYDMRMISSIANLPANTDAIEVLDKYTERQVDRWGTYKQSFYNANSNGGLNNSEFPYSIQDNGTTDLNERELADRFASKWQLNQVVTPTGSIIKIDYESDDYAYVQNRRAMQMFILDGFVPAAANPQGLINSSRLKVKLMKPWNGSPVAAFIDQYLREADGTIMKKLFFKARTDINNQGRYEFVHGYAELNEQQLNSISLTNGATIVEIPIKSVNGYNPISKAAWQMLYSDLPQFAYDNYDNTNVGDGVAAIQSIITALKGLDELKKRPDERAVKYRFASVIDPSKSMVRLYNPDGIKLGGGSRVQKITISDEWKDMTGDIGKNLVTGQYFEYKTKNNKGIDISSGVAAYEPSAGNEENPFHEPISFTETVQWSSDRHHSIEKPFCETYFPAPSVGYSKITSISFGDGYSGTGRPNVFTGYIESEYYTAKDFPTIVDFLNIETLPVKNSLILRLFTAQVVNKLAVTQGFKVELNDMHGKVKGVKVFDKSDKLISSTLNIYSVEDNDAEFKKLKNEVDILDETGVIHPNTTVATDVDFITDMRESISETKGSSKGAYFGAIIFVLFNVPHGAVKVNSSENIDHFHSSSAVKVIHRFGILKKVITTKHGSTIEAENLLWDGTTGEVILSRTQNEFEKYTYSFTYPAHMVKEYEGLAGAYKNLENIFSSFQTDASGKITAPDPSVQAKYLFPGDELVDMNSSQPIRGWVVRTDDGFLRLIDEAGEFINTSGPASWKVLRSGRKNLLAAGTGTVITMKDPRINGRISLDVDKRILDSKAIAYNELWETPVNPRMDPGNTENCITAYAQESSGSYNIFSSTTITDPPPHPSITGADCFINEFTASIFQDVEPEMSPDWHYEQKSRAFMDFGTVVPANPNLEIVSASLSLYGKNTTGNNESWIERVTQLKPCPVQYTDLNWNNQPTVTTTNRVQLTRSTTAQQNYLDVDVTNMFRDWHVSRDVSDFRIAMRLMNETYTGAAIRMEFHDSGPFSPAKPKLTICYIDRSLVCSEPVNKPINPYFSGVLGNWRPYINYVYTVKREQKPGNPTQTGGTDIRNSGYYTSYTPFYSWKNGVLTRNISDNVNYDVIDLASRWVWSNRSVYYDQKGNEIESVDALTRYSAALFGYQQSLSTAVAVNARHNEIAFDGFEDYYFDLGDPNTCPLSRHLDFGLVKQGNTWSNGHGQLTSAASHTGRYSFQLNGSTTITKNEGSISPFTNILGFDDSKRYQLQSNELAKGFAPINEKKYLLSLWVKDEVENDNKVHGLNISINTVGMDVPSRIVPVVEGWKRLEIEFDATEAFNIEFNGTVKIDDVRILPYDGQLVSYVYDDRTLRLMAQLDENNFATFYEYDEEGTPVRLKKETERGVMTLKESRQSLRSR